MSTVATFAGNPLWYLARGTGLVALVLLTCALAAGVAVAGPAPRLLPRFAAQRVHGVLGMSTCGAVALHVVCVVVDGYVPIGWLSALVPFLTGYRTVGVALGTVAFDALLLVVATSLLRVRLGYRAWWAVHAVTYVAWPVALLHEALTGTDAGRGIGVVLAACCAAVVVVALTFRTTLVARHRQLTRTLAGRVTR